jgi:DNA polymerase III delta prime subunit
MTTYVGSTELMDSVYTELVSRSNVLIHGLSGIGKTTFALCLAEEYGYQPIRIDLTEVRSVDLLKRYEFLESESLDGRELLVIMENIDIIPSPKRARRKFLTYLELIRRCKYPIIGITIDATKIHRRFKNLFTKFEMNPKKLRDRIAILKAMFPDTEDDRIKSIAKLSNGNLKRAITALKYDTDVYDNGMVDSIQALVKMIFGGKDREAVRRQIAVIHKNNIFFVRKWIVENIFRMGYDPRRLILELSEGDTKGIFFSDPETQAAFLSVVIRPKPRVMRRNPRFPEFIGEYRGGRDLRITWTEEYRPHTLGGIVGNEVSVNQLKSKVDADDDDIPHYIMVGLPGTGKTTAALAFTYEKTGVRITTDFYKDSRVCKINCASKEGRSIDKLAEMKEFIRSASFDDYLDGGTGMKYLILEEFDNATPDLMKACRVPFESESFFVAIILTANYPERIEPAIIDRCQVLEFGRLTVEELKGMAGTIIEEKEMSVSDKALDIMIERCEGIPRKLIITLQSFSSFNRTIRFSDLETEIGDENFESIMSNLNRNNILGAIDIIKKLRRKSSEYQIVRRFYKFLLRRLNNKPGLLGSLLVICADAAKRIKIGAEPLLQVYWMLETVRARLHRGKASAP